VNCAVCPGSAVYDGHITAPKTGAYKLALTGMGDATLDIDGQRVATMSGADGKRAVAETPTLKSLDRAISEGISAETALEAEHGDAGRDELLAKLQAARTELQPKAQALREADDWQRWANAGVQERLIGEMEKLATATDPMAALRRMRELSVEWKAVASAPRDRAEALWNRFRAHSEAVRAHFEPLRAQRATEQAEHLTRKVALCERAEALRESTDWIATADALKALQAEWKTVGPAPRRDEQAVWERFRAACNAFFTRRQDDLKRRKDEWTINLEKKEALIARAEALVESTDPDKAFVELKGLQAEWKAIGPVRKSKSEQVWQRFRTAADKVFDRYRNRTVALKMLERAVPDAVMTTSLAFSTSSARPATMADGPVKREKGSNI